MESGEDQMEMLDLLASNCTKLRQDLTELSEKGEEERLILNYLREADHQPIADIPSGLDWCNVTEPLSLDGNLRGKIVVLDFFTYCCINCMHILPDLAKLEEEFSVEKGVVVIGVHSAKFANEKDSKNITSAAQRYNILHPVVNDSKFQMWKKLKVHCWPTLLILGPRKNPLFVLMGEGHGKLLRKYVAASLKYYGDEIKSHSLPVSPSIEMLKGRIMKFPAKITSNSEGHLAISDSGNHRILIIAKSGEVLHEIGGREEPGFKDGDFKTSRFNSPQGLCYYGASEEDQQIIFVADTENHAIRMIDLKKQTVETLVGTGRQGSDYQGGKSKDQPISSPWDVAMHTAANGARMVLIAMAGTHQIWAYFLDDCIWWKGKQFSEGQCAAIAGNGHEENRNNSYPNNAAFAQPSGLALDTTRGELFIADSESSSIRKLGLADGKVSGVVGGDRNPQNLFAFGDVDGKQFNAKLQHPLGVCSNPKDNYIYVADTYNHKLKRIDPNTSTIETLDIKQQDSGAAFLLNEPGGLCVDETGENLIVANTNNHTIDRIDLKTLKGSSIEIRTRDEMDVVESDLIYPQISAQPNGSLVLSFNIQLAEGIHFTDGAPQKIRFEGSSLLGKEEKPIDVNGHAEFKWKMPNIEVAEKCIFKVRLSLCKDDVCFPKMFTLETALNLNLKNPDSVNQAFKVYVDQNAVRM